MQTLTQAAAVRTKLWNQKLNGWQKMADRKSEQFLEITDLRNQTLAVALCKRCAGAARCGALSQCM
jgi:hypothetical protein